MHSPNEQIPTARSMSSSPQTSSTTFISSRWTIRYLIAILGTSMLWLLLYTFIRPVSDWFVFHLLALDPNSHSGIALAFFIYDTVKILLLLMALIYGISWLRVSLNVERVRDCLSGKNRGIGYMLGALFGAITPFCSCSSIPLFLGFTMARIPLGVTMAFLITSPLVNELAVVLLWGMIGWEFTVFYVAVGILSGIAGGLFMDAIKAERWLQPFILESLNRTDPRQQQLANDPVTKFSIRQRHLFAYSEMTLLLKRVWKWVILGIGVGAILHGFTPENWFAENLGAGEWWTVPAAVLAGIPLYVNVTGIIPIMDGLLAKGLPLGTTLAFCMSSVVASIPEMMLLRQIMTIRLLITFVCYLWIIFTLVGWLFNAFAFGIL